MAGIYDAASAANPALRKKLAPTGWHIPTDWEWSNLINCLDPNAGGGINFPNIAGGKMKATGTIQSGTGLWEDPNTSATNESDFSGIPAGCRPGDGTFYDVGIYGYWWSSSEESGLAWFRSLNCGNGNAFRYYFNKQIGFSVRCVRD